MCLTFGGMDRHVINTLSEPPPPPPPPPHTQHSPSSPPLLLPPPTHQPTHTTTTTTSVAILVQVVTRPSGVLLEYICAWVALRGGAASLAQMVVSDADSMMFNDLGDSPQNSLVQFGSLVTPSLRGDVDCPFQFSDLVKESLCDAATRFSAMLAALVLVLPSCVWHYPCCFQLVFMLFAAFVAFLFFIPGVENIFEDKPKAGLGCGLSKGKDSTKFPWKFGDKVGTFSTLSGPRCWDPGGRTRCCQ